MNIRRYALQGAAVLLLSACGGDGGSGTGTDPNPPTQPGTGTPVTSASVTAGSNSNDFTPQTVDLKAGGTVTWSFGSRAHDVNFSGGTGAPADIPATTNAQVTRTFPTVGTFNYACGLHAGMTGTVRVQS